MARISVLVAVAQQLLQAGIASIIGGSSDMQVVAVVNNHTDAVSQVHRMQPDVIVTDFDLSTVGAIELSSQIKQAYPHIAVLILSGNTGPSSLLRALKVGVAGYLLRSATASQVLSAIRAVHSGEIVIDPKIIHSLADQPSHSSTRASLDGKLRYLSERELAVLKLTATGMSNKRISQKLFISERTVQAHLRAIFEKLGANSRTEAVVFAIRNGWVTEEDLDCLTSTAMDYSNPVCPIKGVGSRIEAKESVLEDG